MDPIKPILPLKGKLSDQLIDLNADYMKIPELKAFHGLMWKQLTINDESTAQYHSEKWRRFNSI